MAHEIQLTSNIDEERCCLEIDEVKLPRVLATSDSVGCVPRLEQQLTRVRKNCRTCLLYTFEIKSHERTLVACAWARRQYQPCIHDELVERKL